MQRVYYFIWQSYTISLDVLCSWCVFLNLLVKMCLIFEVLACALVVCLYFVFGVSVAILHGFSADVAALVVAKKTDV